jgi:hypothetical protein
MQNKSDSFLLLVLGSSQRVHVICRKANICSGVKTLTLFLSGANGGNYSAPPSPVSPKRCRRIHWHLATSRQMVNGGTIYPPDARVGLL